LTGVLGTEEIPSVSHLGMMILSNNKSNDQRFKQVTPQKIACRMGLHTWKMIQSLWWEERELLKGLMQWNCFLSMLKTCQKL
jgi:hypothetical protein